MPWHPHRLPILSPRGGTGAIMSGRCEAPSLGRFLVALGSGDNPAIGDGERPRRKALADAGPTDADAIVAAEQRAVPATADMAAIRGRILIELLRQR